MTASASGRCAALPQNMNQDDRENADPSRASHSTHVASGVMVCRATGVATTDEGKCREHGGTQCLVCSICFVQALNDVDVKPVGFEPIHSYFGLSYASYLVVPRSLLQSMPDAWQARLVRCLEELFDVYDNHAHYVVQTKDEAGKFTTDNLADYDRGRRYVVPGEEQDTAWRENREARYLEKFKAEHDGMTPQEYAVHYREQKQKEEDAQYAD